MIRTKLFIFFGFLAMIIFGTAIYLNRQWKQLISQQIKNDNPTPGEKLRVSEINFKRPDSASFINMNWKAVFGSIKESIGIDEITKQKMETRLQDFKVEKAERAERREERLKRRGKRKNQ